MSISRKSRHSPDVCFWPLPLTNDLLLEIYLQPRGSRTLGHQNHLLKQACRPPPEIQIPEVWVGLEIHISNRLSLMLL